MPVLSDGVVVKVKVPADIQQYVVVPPSASDKVKVVQGPIGAPGVDGADGVDGTSITAGAGAPSGTANPGDLYLDAASGDLYRYA